MEKMIGYCGIVCTECKGYIATQKNDNKEREKVAESWSKLYNKEFKPEDVNCDGCLTERGRHIGYCNICEIRKCGQEKNVLNCAYCNDYPCKKLNDFFNMAPDAKTTLEEIKNTI